jgi:hypothetical protein
VILAGARQDVDPPPRSGLAGTFVDNVAFLKVKPKSRPRAPEVATVAVGVVGDQLEASAGSTLGFDMSDDYLWLAEIDGGVSPMEVQAKLTEWFGNRVNLAQVAKEAHFREEAALRLRQFGPTRVVRMAERIDEALMRRGASPDVLAAFVNGMLRGLSSSPSELIIVDPFFFKRSNQTPPNYADIIDGLWAGVVESVSSLVIVTDHTAFVDPGLVKDACSRALARNPKVRFKRVTTDAFHDRFWIVDRSKGLFLGTSANSLGYKYALADRLEDADVADIIAELIALRLLTPLP